MSDDIFFNKVRSTMANYSPDVPGSVYSGMRRKLWLSHFVRLDMTRFNVWYILLIGGLAAGSMATMSNASSEAFKATTYRVELNGSPLMTWVSPESDDQIASSTGAPECSSASPSGFLKTCTLPESTEQVILITPLIADEDAPESIATSPEHKSELLPATEVINEKPATKTPKGRPLKVNRLHNKN